MLKKSVIFCTDSPSSRPPQQPHPFHSTLTMNVLILAAGYATRLYPLTQNQPKPLLEVAGKPMMEWVIDNLAPIEAIENVYVVTNNKFAGHFQKWADSYAQTQHKLSFVIVNDQTTSDADKLGAIGDINLVVKQHGLDASDLIVVAGDNLFSESLEDFGRFCKEAKSPVLGIYDVGSLEEAKKYGVVATDEKGVIKSFVEKPEEPASTLIGIALYYYPAATVQLIKQYLAEGNNADQPGRLVQWLYPRQPVHTWKVPGTWFDVGSLPTLQAANEMFTDFAAS